MATYMGSYSGPSLAFPTIVPFPAFHVEADVQALQNALKGLGTDEETIIVILANRSSVQRQEIAQQYKLMTGSDLMKDFKSKLNNNFKETVCGLMLPIAKFDAEQLCKATKAFTTDEKCLIEILSSRTNDEIKTINDVYFVEFRRKLDADITDDTSGPLRKLLVSLSTGNRSESAEVDETKARREAQELYDAGENRWGTDESTFLKIIASRSYPQLRATFRAYHEIAQRDIINSIEREMSGDTKKAYLSVVQCINDPADFFAQQLYQSMKGMGTDDKTLIRIIVSRAEIDLGNIKLAFFNRYQKALHIVIDSDTSGNYRDLLLAILKP